MFRENSNACKNVEKLFSRLNPLWRLKSSFEDWSFLFATIYENLIHFYILSNIEY